MKKLLRPALTIGLSLILALFSAALTYSGPPANGAAESAVAVAAQATPTPPQEDKSEVGSTTEISIMAGVIVLIIIVPILLTRKSWR